MHSLRTHFLPAVAVLLVALPAGAQDPVPEGHSTSLLRPRHAFARSWHTVVVPAALPAWGEAHVTWANPRQHAAIVTASLPPSAAPAKPMIGVAHQFSGIASYYWQDQMTSSGERFNKRDFTAAHKTLPLGTRVRVTHTASGRSVVVRINDRGPFKPGRVIDLSEAAAEALNMTSAGLAQVQIEVVR